MTYEENPVRQPIAQTTVPALFSMATPMTKLWQAMSAAPLKKLPNSPYVLQIGLTDADYLIKRNRDACGMDANPNLVSRLVSAGLRCRVGDAASETGIPYPDEEFLAVVLMDVVEFYNRNELNRFFEEVYRVMKPDGTLLIMAANNKGFQAGCDENLGYKTLITESELRIICDGKFRLTYTYGAPLSSSLGGDATPCNRNIFWLTKM